MGSSWLVHRQRLADTSLPSHVQQHRRKHLLHFCSIECHLDTFGVPVELGPVETHGAAGAGLSVYFRDPDGSLLEFITYPTA